MKRKVEIFTAGCPVCESTVKMVQEIACKDCEIITYDLVKQCDDKTCKAKVKSYGIQRVPSVVVDGKLLNCCRNNAVRKEDLVAAGIGQSL